MRNPLLFRWKKGEGEDSSAAAISFPATGSLDNRGSILPDALNTADALERYAQVSEKLEALIAKDGKDGEIQDSSAAVSFPATGSVDDQGSVLPDALNTADALERYTQVSEKLEALIAKDGKDAEIQSVIAEVPDILLKSVNRDEASLAVAQKVFKSLYDNTSNSGCIMWYVATLAAIRDICKLVVKELTNWVIYLDNEKKFNIEIIFCLIRSDLLNVGEYNVHLAKLIDGGRNMVATEFAMSLVQKLITRDSVSISELYDVVDALSKISRRPGSPESLQQLIEIAKSNANNAPGFAFGKDENVIQSKDKKMEALIARDGKDVEVQDSSAAVSFPATGSVDNRGSVLPDALNTADALERYAQVSEKLEALIAKDGKDAEIQGMLKYSTRLQPRYFRPSTVRWASKALQMQVNKLFKEILQSDIVLSIKGQLDSILQSFRNSEDLIWKEQQAIVGLEEKQKIQSYYQCQPLPFMKEYGPQIQSLEETCKSNHKALNRFETGLFLNYKNNDPLLLAVSDLHERNKITSKEVSSYAKMFYDYRCRFGIEASWILEMAKRLEGNHELFTIAASKVRDLENEVLELIDIVDDLIVLVKESPDDFKIQTVALRTLVSISESANIFSKVCSWVDEDVTCMSCVCKNVRNLLLGKQRCAARFRSTEIEMAQAIPGMKRLIDNLQREVKIKRISYDEKMRRLKDVQGSDTKNYTYKNVEGNSDFSMRDRKWGGRNVCPSIRTQGRGKCSYVATVSCTESRYKRMSAEDVTFGRQIYHQDEFIIKLSPDHLEDMVEQYYIDNSHRKPSEKLDVALERMKEKGVASEEAYNDANFDLQDYKRYRISSFEKLNTDRVDVACGILKEGKALIGNFKITTEYYRLGENDVYEIPEDAVFETTTAGTVSSHCVVIVGFGNTPDGLSYYIFQNSYGPAWGSDGYGRIACSSLKRLYSADV